MGLFKRIDEAVATARESHRLAVRYAAEGLPAVDATAIAPDRTVEHEQPLIAA